jgi:hypothetical protein
MSDRRPPGPDTPQPPVSPAPTITATAGFIITGAGFLPDHEVLVRVIYPAEDISDYLTYWTDSGGRLSVELPTGPHTGALQITATDRRTDPDGAAGLLWSNTQTVPAAGA